MEKEELLLIHGTDYKAMTKEILHAAELSAQIGARDKKIGIKPNLVAPSEAPGGLTTPSGSCGGNHRISAGGGISESHHAGRLLGGG